MRAYCLCKIPPLKNCYYITSLTRIVHLIPTWKILNIYRFACLNIYYTSHSQKSKNCIDRDFQILYISYMEDGLRDTKHKGNDFLSLLKYAWGNKTKILMIYCLHLQLNQFWFDFLSYSIKVSCGLCCSLDRKWKRWKVLFFA